MWARATEAMLHVQFNITAMDFNRRFDFISFWFSYPTIKPMQVVATETGNRREYLWKT